METPQDLEQPIPRKVMAHGGMIAAARALYPAAPTPWLDLSTGINAQPYVLRALDNRASTCLPDDAALADLQVAAAHSYGVLQPDLVVAFPGTEILIRLLPHVLAMHGARVCVMSPTYSSHATSWRAAGHSVVEVDSLSALAAGDVAVLCNPNNPDGRVYQRAALLDVASRVQLLVVDEAFADLEPRFESMADCLPHPQVLVMRSFGKTYGLAGMRLGFALTDTERAARLRRAIGSWAISGHALAAGLQALPDAAWRATIAARLNADIARLDAMVAPMALSLIGGTRLFRLYRYANAHGLWHHLATQGILTRRFEGHTDWLRFGLPGNEHDWVRLATALGRAVFVQSEARS